MRMTSTARGFALALMALALLAVFGSIGSAAPPRTVADILGDTRSTCPNCPEMQSPVPANTTWTTREASPAVASAGCACGANCGCAASAAALTVSRFERARLFPRARGFVSTVAERSPKPLRRLVMTVMSRYRR